MATSLPNVWHLRTVAEASSKACYICYKPTTRVLVTPDNKDFFYICPGHLEDRGFASPIVDAEAEAAKRKDDDLKREIEKIKQEYEEKQRKKKQKRKAEEDTKDKDGGKAKKKTDDEDDGKAEKERDEKIKALKGTAAEGTTEDAPRIYALHKDFYQMRVDRIRNIELAKRNQQRLKNPALFPSAPKGDLS